MHKIFEGERKKLKTMNLENEFQADSGGTELFSTTVQVMDNLSENQRFDKDFIVVLTDGVSLITCA